MKKNSSKTVAQDKTFKTNVIQIDSVKLTANGNYMIKVGKNLIFLNRGLLNWLDKNSNKKAS